MARAHQARTRARRPASARGAGPGLSTRLLWLGGGLAGGLVLGYAGYYLSAQLHQQTGIAPVPPVAVAPPARTTAPAQAAPAAPPSSAPKAEPTPQRFDFYTLLPEMEVVITDDKLDEVMRALPKSDDRGPYVLQLGSFRRHDEADGLRARLALIGIEAGIQTVVIRDDDVWYRVRVGPYDSLRDVSQIRNRLNRNNISHMLIRLGA